ncbi:MAG: hypothetical protein PHF10_01920 [Patescibacteria group bacterium]|nr:hypothetical protein [Patescibacteria group bacterium]
MVLFLTSLIGIIGFVFLIIAALKPNYFWPLLIMASIGASGIVIQKIGLPDEYLLGCILIGIFLAISIQKFHLHKDKKDIWDQLHELFFFSMIIYMVFQSFYGMVEMESLRKFRWMVYFGMLGIFAFCLPRTPFLLSKRKLSLIIANSSLVYFAAYILVGVFYDSIAGKGLFWLQTGRWAIQNLFWGGTTYAAFPLLIALPAIFFLIKDKSSLYRRIGWITLIVILFSAFYYNSRLTQLCIIGFLIMALPIIGFRKFFLYSIIFLLVLIIFITILSPSSYTFKGLGELLWKTFYVIWKPPAEAFDMGDVSRTFHIQAAFEAMKNSNWGNFFFGYGFRKSAIITHPYFVNLWIEYGRPDIAKSVSNYLSEIGFPAIYVGTGLTGLLLLLMNFLLTARKILFTKRAVGKGILLFALFLSFVWLFITDPIDIALFYLMIMPSGLLIKLSEPQEEKII